jgi:hypothetical protein
MNVIKSVSIFLFLVSIGLAFLLYKSIEGPIKERKRVKKEELLKIEKLKILREVEKAYLGVHGEYCGNWDSLVAFVKFDTIFNIQRTEEIILRNYGGDSVVIHIDTVGSISVFEKLFPKSEYPNLNPDRLPNIPGESQRFIIFSDKIEKNNLLVDVFEIKDRSTISQLSELRSKGEPLRVGSRTEVSTTGNWE